MAADLALQWGGIGSHVGAREGATLPGFDMRARTERKREAGGEQAERWGFHGAYLNCNTEVSVSV